MGPASRPNIPAYEPLDCPECSGKLHLRSSRFGWFFGCENFPECRATHGAHPDGRPLGRPADKPTKRARMTAHEAFDKLWADAPALYRIIETGQEREPVVARIRRIARTRAYMWLSVAIGVSVDDCHIGAMDERTCREVVVACEGIGPINVRAWYKDPKRLPVALEGR